MTTKSTDIREKIRQTLEELSIKEHSSAGMVVSLWPFVKRIERLLASQDIDSRIQLLNEILNQPIGASTRIELELKLATLEKSKANGGKDE